ncbi:MAG: MFS transporter [Rhodocyclaceae bacterium]|jgi:MFS family permease|nr:MFS transporter [Rhodocyclaceae bacterium]
MRSPTRHLPAGIWALGLCSLLMDVSSELIHALLPIFLTVELGAGMLAVGLLEGVAEATAAFAKVFSGGLSDRLGRRKPLAVAGYGLAALVKPAFPLADSVATVFGARFVDRVGKGIRGAPRDALVADITPPELRGAAYGLRQSLDALGAVLGPLLAMAILAWWTSDLREAMAWAVMPAWLAVAVLVLGVREPAGGHDATPRPGLLTGWRGLSGAFWGVVGVGAVFTLARASEAFLILRASDAGLAVAWVPVVLVVVNLVYSASAYPVGHLSDRLGPQGLLLAGMGVLVVADGVLAYAPSVAGVLGGCALWGLHMGLTQGILARLVADAAPPALRGTAFGVFNLITGVALFLASALAGGLWNWGGPEAAFLAGAGLAGLAAMGLMWADGRHSKLPST